MKKSKVFKGSKGASAVNMEWNEPVNSFNIKR